MKSTILFLAVTSFLFGSDPLNTLSIPDPIFKRYLIKNFDKNNDQEIDIIEAERIYALSCYACGIKDITGIEYFTNLIEIDLQNNQIKRVPPLKAHKNIYRIFMDGNQIETIESWPPNPTALFFNYNNLQQIPTLPNSPLLRNLQFYGNYLTSFPALPDNLHFLALDSNELRSIGPLPESLRELVISNNRLEALPELPANLDSLYAAYNANLDRLPTLPPKIQYLSLSYTGIRDIPTLYNEIRHLELEGLELHSADFVTNLLELSYLNLADNHLSEIPALDRLSKLQTLWLNNNYFNEDQCPNILEIQSRNLVGIKGFLVDSSGHEGFSFQMQNDALLTCDQDQIDSSLLIDVEALPGQNYLLKLKQHHSSAQQRITEYQISSASQGSRRFTSGIFHLNRAKANQRLIVSALSQDGSSGPSIEIELPAANNLYRYQIDPWSETLWRGTGLAFVNTGHSTAELQFSLLSQTGVIKKSFTDALPSSNKWQKTLQEIFPALENSDWIQISSTQPLRGLCFYLDPVGQVASKDLETTLSKDGLLMAQDPGSLHGSFVHVINGDPTEKTLTFFAKTLSGQTSIHTFLIGPLCLLKIDLAEEEWLQNTSLAQGIHWTSNGNLSVTTHLEDSAQGTQLLLPSLSYATIKGAIPRYGNRQTLSRDALSFWNPNNGPADLLLKALDDEGRVLERLPLTLSPGELKVFTSYFLMFHHSRKHTSIEFEASRPIAYLAESESYWNENSIKINRGLIAQIQAEGSSYWVPHIPNQERWSTELSLFNSSTTNTLLFFEARDPKGNLLASTQKSFATKQSLVVDVATLFPNLKPASLLVKSKMGTAFIGSYSYTNTSAPHAMTALPLLPHESNWRLPPAFKTSEIDK